MIHYLFSINTGRSGSQYLYKLLSGFDNISSHHEPNPVGNGKPMIAFNNGDELTMKEVVRQKKKWIKAHLQNNKNVYAETNHTFIKGFGWLLANEIQQQEIGIVILQRDENEIIDSLRRIRTTPLNESGRVWLLSPNADKNEIKLLKIDLLWFKFLFKIHAKFPNNGFVKMIVKRQEAYYLRWYIKEHHARTKVFMKIFPNIKYFETNIKNLNSEEELKRMFEFFKIPYNPSPRLFDILGKPANLKREKSLGKL